MSEELNFVEVLMIQYQPGDKEFENFFQYEVDCFDIDEWGDAVEEIKEVKEALKVKAEREVDGRLSFPTGFNLPDLLITKPLTAFQFTCFGQNFNRDHSTPLEWEVSEMGNDYVFKGWLEELKGLSQQILADKQAMGDPKADGKVVRFITLWSYSAWQGSYYHEWDSEWELLGRIDTNQIKSALSEAEKVSDGLVTTADDEEIAF